MVNNKKINEDIERLQPTGNPQMIVPSITLRMHPEGATLPVEAYAVPSAFFAAGGSHTFLVSEDRSLNWGNAGRGWWDTAHGEEQTRVVVAQQDAYYDWLLEFSPPINDNFWKTGINFGFNGLCHTITNRQLLLGEKFVTVSDAQKAYLTTAIYGLFGLGLDDLRKRLTDSYNATQHLTKLPDGTLEKVLAKLNYDPEIDLDAWAHTLGEMSQIPMGVLLAQHPDIKELLMSRITTYRRDSEATYIRAMREEWLQDRYQVELARLLIDFDEEFVFDLLDRRYITQDTANRYIARGNEIIRDRMGVAVEQHEIVAHEGKMDDSLGNRP